MKNRVHPKDPPETEVLPDDAQEPNCGAETQELRGLSVQEIERLLKTEPPSK